MLNGISAFKIESQIDSQIDMYVDNIERQIVRYTVMINFLGYVEWNPKYPRQIDNLERQIDIQTIQTYRKLDRQYRKIDR